MLPQLCRARSHLYRGSRGNPRTNRSPLLQVYTNEHEGAASGLGTGPALCRRGVPWGTSRFRRPTAETPTEPEVATQPYDSTVVAEPAACSRGITSAICVAGAPGCLSYWGVGSRLRLKVREAGRESSVY